MIDFGMLPPEVNSARMYAGAGAGPLLAAASAWDGLSAELSSAATSYRSVVIGLADEVWHGPASASMAAAAAPYIEWMQITGTQAAQAAMQARAAAAAYEQAFMSTVPPPAIAVNRSLLATLVATNILGQNTPAIAANQAEYAEMWAQDATAMFGYSGASAAATQLIPFSAAAQDTNPAGVSSQNAAVSQATAGNGLSQAMTMIPNTLQTAGSAQGSGLLQPIIDLLQSPFATAVSTLESQLNNVLATNTGTGFMVSGVLYMVVPLFTAALSYGWPFDMAATEVAGGLAMAGGGLISDVSGSGAASALAGSYAPGMAATGSAEPIGGQLASLGRSGTIGGLSVPSSWGTTAPEIRLASAVTTSPGGGLAGSGGMFGGMPPVASVVNAPKNGDGRSRYGARSKIVAELCQESGGAAPGAWSGPKWRAPDVISVADERAELERLRKANAELAMDCDEAARLIGEAVQS